MFQNCASKNKATEKQFNKIRHPITIYQLNFGDLSSSYVKWTFSYSKFIFLMYTYFSNYLFVYIFMLKTIPYFIKYNKIHNVDIGNSQYLIKKLIGLHLHIYYKHVYVYVASIIINI